MTSPKKSTVLQEETNQKFIFEQLYLKFPNSQYPILHISNLLFNWSGIATLQGPSGSGKTSFFRLLSGWYADSNAQQICNVKPAINRFKSVRMIGGHATLLPWKNLLGNFKFHIGEVGKFDIEKAINSVGLGVSVLNRYPYELSLGMYKRLELVIAVLQNPIILLLDEFFSSIDPEAKKEVINFIKNHRRNSLTLASVHEEDLRDWIGGHKLSFVINEQYGTVVGIDVS